MWVFFKPFIEEFFSANFKVSQVRAHALIPILNNCFNTVVYVICDSYFYIVTTHMNFVGFALGVVLFMEISAKEKFIFIYVDILLINFFRTHISKFARSQSISSYLLFLTVVLMFY